MIYEQNIYWAKFNYISDRFWHETSWMSGIREESNNRINISVGRSLSNEIGFVLDDKRIDNLGKFFRKAKKKVQEKDLNFDTVLYLHNEIVLINKTKRDDRSFGFIRIIIKKKGITLYIEDVPIYRNNLSKLEKLVGITVLECCKKYNQIGEKKEKKLFANMPHVLSPKAAGYFIHEIIGHLLECDYYGVFKDKYKDLKISPLLTVVDSIDEEKNVAGIGKYDDEGNVTKSVILIEKGEIHNLISTDKTLSLDNKLYGFARRSSYKEFILPRMRNTYIIPNPQITVKDILNQYRQAVYINEVNYGTVDYSSGEFKLYGNGFILENGLLKNYIGELRVYGNIFKDISAVDYIGDDFKMYGGYCGKMGQSVYVGYGGPTISLREMSSEGEIYERGKKS